MTIEYLNEVTVLVSFSICITFSFRYTHSFSFLLVFLCEHFLIPGLTGLVQRFQVKTNTFQKVHFRTISYHIYLDCLCFSSCRRYAGFSSAPFLNQVIIGEVSQKLQLMLQCFPALYKIISRATVDIDFQFVYFSLPKKNFYLILLMGNLMAISSDLLVLTFFHIKHSKLSPN